MNSTNRKLLVAALLLLALSAMTHWNAVSRADRFERGQKLLPNLDPDEIAAIEIRSAGDTVNLRRDGDGFSIAEENGYRAKNEEVNRIVRDLQEVSLVKRVGAGDGLAAELGFAAAEDSADAASTDVDPLDAATDAGSVVEVALKDASGGDMVRLELGAAGESGGTYVRRRDGEDVAIYLTEDSVRLADTSDRFLDIEIVDVPSSDLERVEAADFVLVRGEEGGDLELTELPDGRKTKSVEVNKIKNLLSRFVFEDVFVADHPEVRALSFADALRYDLTDGSGYSLQSATEGERTFVRINGFHTVERVEIAMDTTEEEMEEKSDILHRAEEIDAFNAFHGSWVYVVDSATAEKLALTKGDLLETS